MNQTTVGYGKTFNFQLTEDDHKKLAWVAYRRGVSKATVVREALRREIAREETNEHAQA